MKTDINLVPMSEAEQNISLISKLLIDSKLYRAGNDYKELLDFVNRMPNFAPFNAFLLQIQKPGLLYAGSADDWRKRYRRSVKEGARPLIIMWPFSPIALVYDVEDTEGDPLPDGVVHPFKAQGCMDEYRLKVFFRLAEKQGIFIKQIEYGDGHAGHISRPEHDVTINSQSNDKKQKPNYQIRINQRHNFNVQFATLTHELAHLYLGHLGRDRYLNIPDRYGITHVMREIEAESVCYMVCHRNGVEPNSESYLSGYVDDRLDVGLLDLYAILKAAGQVETLLGLTVPMFFSKS